MAKLDKVDVSLPELQKMAADYGVGNNALVAAAIKQYVFQLKVIDEIRQGLEESGEMLTSKEYVKGRENQYANPLIKELPKHSDAANKTAATIMNLIQNFGHAPKVEGKLQKLMNDDMSDDT